MSILCVLPFKQLKHFLVFGYFSTNSQALCWILPGFIQVAVRHSQGREPEPLFTPGQNEVSRMAGTWKPALAKIKPPGALNKTGCESELGDGGLGQEQLLLSRLCGASKAPRAPCPATCCWAGSGLKTFPGQGQVAPTRCKERGNSPSCSQTGKFAEVTEVAAGSLCWIQAENTQVTQSHCRPFPLLKAAVAAAVLLWGNIIKVLLPDVWSFWTDLSHMVVI